MSCIDEVIVDIINFISKVFAFAIAPIVSN